jgi:hypothetical protein
MAEGLVQSYWVRQVNAGNLSGLRTLRDTPADSDCLRLSVVFKTVEGNRAALLAAKSMSACLGADVALIEPQVVPYPLALDRPPLSPVVTFRTLGELAHSVAMRPSLYVCVCRDVLEGLLGIMPVDMPILFGLRSRRLVPGFLLRPVRLAAALRRHGCEVVTVRYK